MITDKMNELWDYMVDNAIATNEEIHLVVKINGATIEAMEDILYVRTGYRTLRQIKEAHHEA